MNGDQNAKPSIDEKDAVSGTKSWLEDIVIGLNLCPFAKAVQTRGQVHYSVWLQETEEGLVEHLLSEAQALVASDASLRDTTLLVTPNVHAEFFGFNAFVAKAERRLARAGYEGVLQLASFHPDFVFVDSLPDDIANATNRAPFPTFHLLREASIDRAVAAFPQADVIYERNIQTMKALGQSGWAALQAELRAAPRT